MKRKKLNIIALLVFLCMVSFVPAACISKTSIEDDKAATTQDDKKPDLDVISSEKITLTMFTMFPAGHAAIFKTLNDSPNFQALEEATNIKVNT